MIHCGSGHLLLVLFVHCINSAHNDDWRLTSDWWWLEPVYDLQWPAESSFKGYPYNTGYRDPAEYKTEMPKDIDWISSVSNPGSISTYRQGRRQDLVPASRGGATVLKVGATDSASEGSRNIFTTHFLASGGQNIA